MPFSVKFFAFVYGEICVALGSVPVDLGLLHHHHVLSCFMPSSTCISNHNLLVENLLTRCVYFFQLLFHIRSDKKIAKCKLWIFATNWILTSDCRVNIGTTRSSFNARGPTLSSAVFLPIRQNIPKFYISCPAWRVQPSDYLITEESLKPIVLFSG